MRAGGASSSSGWDCCGVGGAGSRVDSCRGDESGPRRGAPGGADVATLAALYGRPGVGVAICGAGACEFMKASS